MTLRGEIATPDGKRRYVRRLFATIADRYDFITRFLSYGQDQRWKRLAIALAAIAPGDRVLDLACGTGDLAGLAARSARKVVGLDVTHRMLELAVLRAHDAPGRASDASTPSFVTADMLALPFPAASFEVVTTGYGLRNVPDLGQAVREIHRVLVAGGRLVSLDFNRPETPLVRSVYLVYLTLVGSGLGLALHGDPDTYRYIPESIRLYPGARGVATLIENSGFEDVRVKKLLGGLLAIHVARKV